MKPPCSFDFSKAVHIVDEPSVSIKTTKTIEVSDLDIDQTLAKLALEDLDILNQVQPTLKALGNKLPQKARHGFSLSEIKEALPDVSKTVIDRDALLTALAPDLSVLVPPDEVEIEVDELEIEKLKKDYLRDRSELDRQKALELEGFFQNKLASR